MDIGKLAVKPQLVEIRIDNEAIVEAYGEAVTFWMKDQLDIATYFDFYRFQRESTSEQLMNTLRKIVLDAQGQPVIAEDQILPVDLTLEVLGKINEQLGKSKTKLSEKDVGTQA